VEATHMAQKKESLLPTVEETDMVQQKEETDMAQ
jgi:hypothetical protein